MKNLALLALSFALLSGTASAAGRPVMQPYRPLNEAQQWTIEGQRYGLMKVRVSINGSVVADGPMINANFNSTYKDKPVHVTCIVHTPMFGETALSCSVYVSDELAANLVFV